MTIKNELNGWVPAREDFFTPVDAMIDRFFESTFPTFQTEFGINFGSGSYPKVDVIDNTENIIIEAEIPGLSRNDVSVDLEKNILTISGAKRDKRHEDARYIKRELKRSSFKRSFILNEALETKKIDAEFTDGLLTITIGKKQPEKKRKVKIL